MEVSHEEYCFERAQLVLEFKAHRGSSWPPPLNVFIVPPQFFMFVMRRLGQLVGLLKPQASNELDTRGFRLFAAVDYQDTLQRKEQAALEKAAAKQDQASAGKLDSLVHALRDEVILTQVDMRQTKIDIMQALDRKFLYAKMDTEKALAKMKR